MTKLAIVGYGKMGRMIEQLAPSYGFAVAAKVDMSDPIATAEGADVAIEFTTPHAAPGNLSALAGMRVSTVCGTTGWFSQLPGVSSEFEKNGTALVWSPNFSIGVNIFFRLAEETARLMKSHAEYGAWAWEMHHSAKKDAPSGTLLKAVEGMRAAGYDLPVDVASNRAGSVPGTHEIGFDSAADTITLRHTARSREGFARGALEAARWIHGKPAGVHEFSEVLFGRK